MSRTYFVFGDIQGKLDVLRVECSKCARKGRYNVRRLIEKYGRKATEADGPTVFAHACKMGPEGIVSKRLGSPYVSGRSRHWLKSKNPEHPAVKREALPRWPQAGLADDRSKTGLALS